MRTSLNTGDFDAPAAKKPKQDAIETKLNTQPSEEKEVAEKKDNKPEFNPEELAAIFDQIIFYGEYSEEVSIKDKLKVKLRTRTSEETEAINNEVDGSSYQLMATMNSRISLLNLRYALASYAGKDLTGMPMDQKIKFIAKIPTPVIAALFVALAKFDTKVYAACSEGDENF